MFIILLGAFTARLLVPGMEYEKQSVWIFILLLSTCLGNGFFEELLWRGVYYKLFPNNILFRMIWPSIWFGIWHYVPVSINSNELTGLIGMMIGPFLMGLVLSYMTKKTNTIRKARSEGSRGPILIPVSMAGMISRTMAIVYLLEKRYSRLTAMI